MLLVAIYKGNTMEDMSLVSGTSDPYIISQVSEIIKNALDDKIIEPQDKSTTLSCNK